MAQQAQIFDTIASIKRAVIQRDDASDSDTSIKRTTNRGNKLKRKAKYVQQGQLGQGDGPRAYKRKIIYNGYTRDVISRRPPRIDPDGDVVEEDEESNPDLSPAEEDPYQDIRLENILMPLTSAADLDKHPSLSVPYTSQVIEEMVTSTEDMLYREQTALWRVKNVLSRFRGDDDGAPCGLFVTDHDTAFLRSLRPDGIVDPLAHTDVESIHGETSASNWDAMSNARIAAEVDDGTNIALAHVGGGVNGQRNGARTKDPAAADTLAGKDDVLVERQDHAIKDDVSSEAAPVVRDTQSQGPANEDLTNGVSNTSHSVNSTDVKSEEGNAHHGQLTNGSKTAESIKTDESQNDINLDEQHNLANTGTSADTAQDASKDTDVSIQGNEASEEQDVDMQDAADEANPSHRMTTRAKAQATSEATGPTPEASQSAFPSPQLSQSSLNPVIHPFFVPPPISFPNSSGGLPPPLSDDSRRLLSMYVQKQEEVVRQAEALLSGLRRAVRLKNTVWRWCRQEGHVGEMSDGEDWVDAEEWGLDGPLRKGEEVEDEELQVTGKTRRNRRAAA